MLFAGWIHAAAAFFWAFAEATVFPLPPEILLVPLIIWAPAEGLPLAASSLAGSLAGGALSFSFARSRPEQARIFLQRIPGVAPGMVVKVNRWIDRHGVKAVAYSAWTGVSYKIFAVFSGTSRHPWIPFLGASFLARSSRIAVVGWLAYSIGTWWGGPIRRHALLFSLIYAALVVAGYWLNQRANRAA